MRRPYALGAGPWVYETFEQGTKVEVSVLARGLAHPWSMAFIPGTSTPASPMGDAIFTEREGGKVRLIRGGAVEPEPIADLSQTFSLNQLFDVVLHPDFARNRYVYFTYSKTAPRPDGSEGYYASTALARGRFDGRRIEGLEDVFVADGWRANRGGDSTRVAFLPDGTLLLSSSHRLDAQAPQRLDTHIGKILRLKDDGTAPADNPFVKRRGALPEIYSLGHRTVMGLLVHPQTGAIWELENGPLGGDEINVLEPGANYGWPVVSFGRDYDGTRFAATPWREGMEQPELAWVPSITVAGFTFYTGDAFPAWQGNLFVTSMIKGRLPGTGHVVRVVFGEKGELRREEILGELHQRIRGVHQGPDGWLYLLTDENDGAILRVAPAAAAAPLTTGPAALPVPAAATAASPAAGGSAASPASAAAAPPMFPGHDCGACHLPSARSIGPAYADIAARYSNSPDEIARLASRVIEGSVGQWGDVPMAPHSGLSEAAAADLVRQILDLK